MHVACVPAVRTVGRAPTREGPCPDRRCDGAPRATGSPVTAENGCCASTSTISTRSSTRRRGRRPLHRDRRGRRASARIHRLGVVDLPGRRRLARAGDVAHAWPSLPDCPGLAAGRGRHRGVANRRLHRRRARPVERGPLRRRRRGRSGRRPDRDVCHVEARAACRPRAVGALVHRGARPVRRYARSGRADA